MSDKLTDVLEKLSSTLERIETKMEEDTRSYQELRASMDAFRDEIRAAQRRTAEALVHGRRNAERSSEAAQEFQRNLMTMEQLRKAAGVTK